MYRRTVQNAFKFCKNYLESKKRNKIWYIMTWPTQSADFFHTELVWGELDRRAQKENPKKEWSFSVIEECLEGIAIYFFQKPFERMTRFSKAVIKSVIELSCSIMFSSLVLILCQKKKQIHCSYVHFNF